MRARWIGFVGFLGWVLFVVTVAASTDVRAGGALLIGGLGVLVLMATGLGLLVLRRLGPLEAELIQLRTPPKPAPKPKPKPSKPFRLPTREVERVARAVRKDIDRGIARSEAVHGLHAALPIEHVLPVFAGYPAAPDLLVYVLDLVDRHRPKVIVECGSGLSTLCFALALRTFGIDGKVIALEHLEQYAAQTREQLERHGVAELAEVRTAPLEDFELGEDTMAWYAKEAWQDLSSIELLLVDGPPGDVGPLARYPALPLLHDRLAPNVRIVLDDFAREAEQEVLQRWETENPDALESVAVRLERGAALVTFR
ncbi:MAG: class I SAM-dependent methyltransferase [Nocardioidaceae bacterium]|nr:class I SAM-dependent methyltransferase [Nocardioidaceae bacterium]